MTLLRKFGVLLAVLAMVVVLSLGSAVWSVSLLQREITGYLQSISVALGGLNHIKRDLGDLAALLPGSPETDPSPWAGEARDAPPGTPAQRVQALGDSVHQQLEELLGSRTFRVRSGISTQRNLQDRIKTATASALAWVNSGDREAGLRARRELYILHELIERNEAKILGDASEAVVHGREIRDRLLAVIVITLLTALGVASLGLILMRRWVLRPVTELRTAADRIARGDFAHRVPVQGRDELAQLSSEVNHMAGMISAMQDERVERERLAAIGEMVRRLAHNLRNPLSGIRSLAELSKADLPGDSPVQENQDRIVATVDRFEKWLAEMLTATSPLNIEPEPVPVAPWLRALVEPLRPMGAAKGVELRVDLAAAPPEARFDPRHLEHALVGVVTNAIQASPRGAAVTVSAVAKGTQWEIRVRDRGPGVPPELVERIFRPYFTTKRDGTGIGLAVAKQVVEQHGGRVAVERASSAPEGPAAPAPRGSGAGSGGPGATFVFQLPLRVEPNGPGVANIGQAGAQRGQDPDSRGRGEPPVLHPASAQARRA
jgi:signal transduction histidine kinase